MEQQEISPKTPSIRFKGFTDAWEQQRLGDFLKIQRGLTYKPSNITDFGTKVLRSSNISEDSFVLNQDDVHVKESCVNIPYVSDGDILITSANGSSRLVGKHAIIHDLHGIKAVPGGFMLLGTCSNPYFMNASMSSKWYEKFIQVYVAGGNGAIGNLNKSDLEEQIVYFPSEKEQSTIGSFFKSLDTLLTLRQRELDKLKQIKKGLLQKMFPSEGEDKPKIRFKGFTDAWEQQRLGDVLKEGSKKPVDTSKYPKITISLHRGGVHYSELDRKMADTRPFYIRKEGELIIGKQNYFNGSISIVPKEFDNSICSNAIMSFSISKFVDKVFLLEQISKDDYLEARSYFASGTGQKELSEKQFLNFNALFPSFEEQTKIGSLFKSLDSLLTLRQRELDKLKQIKKGLLQRMFA